MLGGETFTSSVLVTEEVLKVIRDNVEIAPLHNPPNLRGINACQLNLPGTPQVAVFDTAFHQQMPKKAYLYGIPYSLYSQYKIRRYGFHGTSHRYVAERAAMLLGKDVKSLKLITCHLGNGCSMAAVDRGTSVDTTMGFSPLEGLQRDCHSTCSRRPLQGDDRGRDPGSAPAPLLPQSARRLPDFEIDP